jgi:hypothetical protein
MEPIESTCKVVVILVTLAYIFAISPMQVDVKDPWTISASEIAQTH